MKNKLAKILALSFLIPLLAYGADEVFQSNNIKFGRKASTADKVIEIEQNAGVNNPKIYSTSTGLEIGLKTAKVKKGKGTAANIIDEFDIGLGATNPKIRWNNTTGKIEFSNDGTTYTAIGAGGGAGGGGVVLNANTGFEEGLTNWTASGGTFTLETTAANVGFATQAGAWDASAASQTLSNDAITVPAGLFGKVCSLSWYYKGGDANLKAQVYDGTNVIAESSAMSAQATYSAKQVMYFTCPSSGTMRARFVASADAAIIYLDDVKLGQEMTYSVSTNGFVGKAVYPGTASCAWQTTGSPTSYVNFPVDTDCPTPTITGNLSAPGTKIPGVVLEAEAGKTYRIIFTGLIRPVAATDGCTFRVSDGTVSTDMIARTGQVHFAFASVGTLTFPTSGTKTLQVQARTEAGGDNCQIVNSIIGNEFNIQVEKLDGAPIDAISVDKSGWRVDAYINGNVSDTDITSSQVSYTELNNANWNITTSNGSAPVEIPCSSTNPSTGSSCAVGNESYGVVFVPPTSGVYEVCAVPSTWHRYGSSGTAEVSWKWVETPNNAQTIIQDGVTSALVGIRSNTGAESTDILQTTNVCNTFTFSDTSKRTLRLMHTAAISGGGFVSVLTGFNSYASNSSIKTKITVTRKIELQDTIKFTNLVTTPKITGEKIIRATVAEGSNCSSSPCTITRQSGNFTSITRLGSGDYQANFTGFSSPPTCSCIHFNGPCNVQSTITSTSYNFVTTSFGAINTPADTQSIQLICVGE